MAKKSNLISIPLHDLLECLVSYSEHLETPPADAEEIPDSEVTTTRRTFSLDTPKQKLEAIETILFGDEEVEGKRGNRSLEDYDRALLLEIKKEHGEEIKTKEQLLDLCVPYATLRNENTSDDSVRARLDKVYKKYQKIGWGSLEDTDFSDFGDDGWADYLDEEIRVLAPWLEKYRDEILRYYLKKPESCDMSKLPSWLLKIYENVPK